MPLNFGNGAWRVQRYVSVSRTENWSWFRWFQEQREEKKENRTTETQGHIPYTLCRFVSHVRIYQCFPSSSDGVGVCVRVWEIRYQKCGRVLPFSTSNVSWSFAPLIHAQSHAHQDGRKIMHEEYNAQPKDGKSYRASGRRRRRWATNTDIFPVFHEPQIIWTFFNWSFSLWTRLVYWAMFNGSVIIIYRPHSSFIILLLLFAYSAFSVYLFSFCRFLFLSMPSTSSFVLCCLWIFFFCYWLEPFFGVLSFATNAITARKIDNPQMCAMDRHSTGANERNICARSHWNSVFSLFRNAEYFLFLLLLCSSVWHLKFYFRFCVGQRPANRKFPQISMWRPYNHHFSLDSTLNIKMVEDNFFSFATNKIPSPRKFQ